MGQRPTVFHLLITRLRQLHCWCRRRPDCRVPACVRALPFVAVTPADVRAVDDPVVLRNARHYLAVYRHILQHLETGAGFRELQPDIRHIFPVRQPKRVRVQAVFIAVLRQQVLRQRPVIAVIRLVETGFLCTALAVLELTL